MNHPSARALVVHAVLWICGYALFSAGSATAQSATVRGFVTAADDGAPLQGVNVVLDDPTGFLKGAVADGDGFFLFSGIQPGSYRLRASFIGFVPFQEDLDIPADGRLLVNIVLQPQALEMEGISVEAEREAGAANVTAGRQTIRARDIELIPSPDISGDLVSYLSTVPSVVMMGDRGGQVFIRGGEPTQNLALVDGIEIYQPFHVLGYYSAFASEIVSHVDVYAGGFGPEFSGKLSSVIDVHTRTGNKRRLEGSLALSPFTASAHLEGPIVPGRLSVLAVTRRSMLDRLAARYVDDPLPYRFSDTFGKVHANVGGNSQLSVTYLDTYDRGILSPTDDVFGRSDVVRWRNEALGMRYLVAPRSLPILGELLVSVSRLETTYGPADTPNRRSDLEQVSVAVNVTNFGRRTEVRWGFFLRTPATRTELDGLFQGLTIGKGAPSDVGAYVQPDIRIGGSVFIQPGLSVRTMGDTGDFMEPRIRLRLERGIHTWSAAAGVYRQVTVGLSDRRDAANVFTAWAQTPSNDAMRSVHYIAGYHVEPVPWMEVSVEGFRKTMDHLFIGEWTSFPRFSTRLQQALGDAHGFDLRLEVRRPRWYGFVNYGWSSTRYELDPANDALVNPGRFSPPHDRRHQVNALLSADVAGFDVSARWQYGSGLPFTPIQGFDGFILMDGVVDVTEVRGFPRVIYEPLPYRKRLPAYHRLDVTVERQFPLIAGGTLTVQVGLMNAYDRANLFSLDLLTAQRTDQLPLVPIAGIKAAF